MIKEKMTACPAYRQAGDRHDRSPTLKKNPCSDCDFCQWCNDSRCGLCMPTGKDPHRKTKPHRPMFLKY